VGKKPWFNNDQRRRLATKAEKIGLQRLKVIAAIVTPRTLLAWHQRLSACRSDFWLLLWPGGANPGYGRNSAEMRAAELNPGFSSATPSGALFGKPQAPHCSKTLAHVA
jgi:hypothetical protein